MKIIVFSESDYNFSAKLAKICDLESDELLFLNKFDSLDSFDNKNTLLIVDFNDYKNHLDLIINLIKSRTNFPVCLLADKIDSKFQKKSTSIGFDIVMAKSIFLMNIKTIKNQIINNSKYNQKQ